MGLTEKTLELNVTHELLAFGHAIWQIYWQNSPHPRPPRGVAGPPMFASGLSLQDEKTQGWDIKLDLPPLGPTSQRVAFLQFKCGHPRQYSKKPGTKFPPGAGTASRHILFGINNNKVRDQHEVLRNTAQGAGAPGSALYVLPIFGSENEVKSAVGQLLARTKFYSIPDIDAEANPPIVNGTARNIAISRSNPLDCEIRSIPKIMKTKDCCGAFLGDFGAIRMQRALETSTLATIFSPRRGQRIAAALADYFAAFVGVDKHTASDIFGFRLPGLRAASPLIEAASTPFEAIAVDRLQEIAKRVEPYMRALGDGRGAAFTAGPPPSPYFAVAKEDHLRLRREPGRPPTSARLRYLVA